MAPVDNFAAVRFHRWYSRQGLDRQREFPPMTASYCTGRLPGRRAALSRVRDRPTRSFQDSEFLLQFQLLGRPATTCFQPTLTLPA